MSYTLIDYFNAFQNLKRKKSFSAGVQSAYFSILAEFNLQRFPAELTLSTRELKVLAGLKSVSSAQDARNILKNNNLVDFHTENGTTVYTLGTEHLPNGYRTLTEQQTLNQPNTNRTPHAQVSTLPVCPRVETETLRRDKDLTATTSACANSQELDNVLDYWAESGFGKLNAEVISKLEVQLRRYGLAEIRAAMDAAKLANGSNYGVSYNFFAKVLENRQSPKSAVKGGEKVAKSSTGFSYKPVTFDDGEELW